MIFYQIFIVELLTRFIGECRLRITVSKKGSCPRRTPEDLEMVKLEPYNPLALKESFMRLVHGAKFVLTSVS